MAGPILANSAVGPELGHTDFAQSVMGGQYKLGQNTQTYLGKKYTFFNEECNRWNKGQAFGQQIGHICKLPALVASHALQTVIDAVILVVLAVFNLITLGCINEARFELAARGYNLLVADTLVWLSLPVSFFCYLAYEGANSLHLGTSRSIDAAKGALDEFK